MNEFDVFLAAVNPNTRGTFQRYEMGVVFEPVAATNFDKRRRRDFQPTKDLFENSILVVLAIDFSAIEREGVRRLAPQLLLILEIQRYSSSR